MARNDTTMRLETDNDTGKQYIVAVSEEYVEADERTLNMLLADAYANLAHHQNQVAKFQKKIQELQALITS